MEKALALSQAEAGEKTRSAVPAARGAPKEHAPLASSSQDAIATAPESNTASSGSGSTSAFLSQRAQLEQERLERQKRLRPQQQQRQATPPSQSNSTTESGSDDEIEERPAKRQHVSTQARAGPSSSTHPAVNQKFWNGELRQTATQHAEPRKDGQPTFRLTEVLGPVSFVFLSYCRDTSPFSPDHGFTSYPFGWFLDSSLSLCLHCLRNRTLLLRSFLHIPLIGRGYTRSLMRLCL